MPRKTKPKPWTARQRYWNERNAVYELTAQSASKQLGPQYSRTANALVAKIMHLYEDLIRDSENGTVLMSDFYRYKRYYKLLGEINDRLHDLGRQEIKITENVLEDMYRRAYEIGTKDVPGFEPVLREDEITRAINSVWCTDGKAWSDRIWSNKTLLQEKLKETLVDGVAQGLSVDRMTAQLMEDMNVGFRQAERIVRTECSHIFNQAALDSYTDAGVEYFEVLSNQADDECLDLNETRFRISEMQIGVNCPPFHPNCRCTVLAVLDKDIK